MTEFEQVYQTYFTDVYRYVLSLCRNEELAQEITQETFFKALQSIDRFDRKCRMYVWLCQIAKNTYFTHLQKQKRHESAVEEQAAEQNIESRLCEKESAFEIHRILHSLKEPYKEVFSLRTFGELPFSQIAILFGKTESWARVTYHRARLMIREEMEHETGL